MQLKKIKLNESAFVYHPGYNNLFLAMHLQFFYNYKSQQFEVNNNPHGDPHLIPMNNVVMSDDFSQLSFDAKYQGKERQFQITAIHECDKIMFELFSRLRNNDLLAIDEDLDDLRLVFENGKLESIKGYKNSKTDGLIDSLNIISEEGSYSLIIQDPWRKINLNSIVVDNNKLISRSADEEFLYNLDIQPVLVETIKRLIDSSVSPASGRNAK
jgi:hypothetical protein